MDFYQEKRETAGINSVVFYLGGQIAVWLPPTFKSFSYPSIYSI
jgi:hypothetical protein